jgi:diphosphomevalonate decarboxylase
MTLGELTTRTTVTFDSSLDRDEFYLNDQSASVEASSRVSEQLDLIRQLADVTDKASVHSQNNFPAAAGLASSASGFAALTVAGAAAADLALDPRALSRLARRASGSASRSIFGGFVEWHAAATDEGSYAEPLHPAEHWELIDIVAVVQEKEKAVGSSAGHQLANSSPIQAARVSSAPERVRQVKEALRTKDFELLARTAELDSDLMHAVMMSSSPPLLYWVGATVEIMHRVRQLRRQGVAVFYTLDAGPNPHCLCLADQADEVQAALQSIAGVIRLQKSSVGGPAKVVLGDSSE